MVCSIVSSGRSTTHLVGLMAPENPHNEATPLHIRLAAAPDQLLRTVPPPIHRLPLTHTLDKELAVEALAIREGCTKMAKIGEKGTK